MAGIVMLARVELRRSWRTLVALGLVAGVGLGVGLGATQLARRSSTAFERLEHATGSPDAVVIWIADEAASAVADLPGVRKTWDATFSVGRVDGDAVLFLGITAGPVPPQTLANPLFVAGRAADPDADDELVITEALARDIGLAVGDVLPFSFLTAAEVAAFDSGFGEPDGPQIRMRVVGVQRAPFGRGDNAPGAFSTPAFARRLAAAGSTYPTTFVRLIRGAAGLPAFERRLDAAAAAVSPGAGAEEFTPYTLTAPSAQRSVVAVTSRVLVAGLLAFGSVAALVALVAAVLALRRQFLLAPDAEARALAAVGVTRGQVVAARCLAGIPFVVAGTAAALGVAVAAGGLGPIGSLGRLEPRPGFHANVGLLAAGAAVTIAILVAGAAVAAVAGVWPASTTPRWSPRASRIVGRLAAIGASPPVLIGTGLAVEPSRGRSTGPARSALVATTLAIAGVVGVMCFASSLDRLVATPARWGWSADALVADASDEIVQRLDADPRIAAVTRISDFSVQMDGRTVTGTVLRGAPGLGWTVLEGRAPRASGEVLVGARLARTVGADVGDRVRVRGVDGERVSLAVVGTGTGPRRTDGAFGRGLLVHAADLDRLARTQTQQNALVAFAPGIDAPRVSRALAEDLELEQPSPPADVDNLSQLGRLPELLAAFLGLLAVAVLSHTISTTARRRRRDLDTLRAVGFVRGQVRGVLVVASTAIVVLGLVMGIGLGFALGGVAWRFTAHAAYVAGDLAVPWTLLAGFTFVSLAVAVAVALVPGWRVTRHPVGEGLRSE